MLPAQTIALGQVQNPSIQSNLRTAYQSRVRVRGNSDSEK